MYRFGRNLLPHQSKTSGNLVGLSFFAFVILSLAAVLSFIILMGNSAVSYLSSSPGSTSSDPVSPSINSAFKDLILYNVAVGIDRSDPASQAFFATDNELEQLFDFAIDDSLQDFGQAVSMANGKLMAVSSDDAEGRMIVLLLAKGSDGRWQESYRFSYDSAASNNYQIPDSETPTDSDDLRFGESLAFYGTSVLAVGAPGWQGAARADDTSTTDVYEADDGTDMGAVYIFRLQNSGWSLAGTIRGTGVQGEFGSAVSFSPAGKLAIGAPAMKSDSCPVEFVTESFTVPANEDVDGDNDIDADDTKQISNLAASCPAVHLYEKDNPALSQWSKTASISASSPEERGFGHSVAFANDDSLAIGATLQYAPSRIAGEGYTRRLGAAHLYAKNSNGAWIKELVVSDFHTTNPGSGKYQVELEDLDRFGQALTFMDADTLVVSGQYKGTLYVLEKSAAGWSQTAAIEGTKLWTGEPLRTNRDGYASTFGQSLSAHGNTLAATSLNGTESSDSLVNLLKFDTFRSSDWHYSYISDDSCDSQDFINSPTAYTEGDLIVPPAEHEGMRFCFKADSGSRGVEYFASEIIDLSAPQFASPSLGISENGILSIYFNERVRQLDDSELDEAWVRANVSSLDITLHGQTSPTTITLNHANSSSTLNSGNSFADVSHSGDQTVLRLQIDSTDASFPPATAPTASAPHTYSIKLKNFEDLQHNSQTAEVTAEEQITGYVDSPPVITVEAGNDQSVSASDNLTSSSFVYVWLDSSADCDETATFNGAIPYTEGSSVHLEEAHNGRQLCFKATNGNDSSLVGYKGYQVSGVDRSPPDIKVVLTTTAVSATATDVSSVSWDYLLLSSRTCDDTTDFASATAYTEGSEIAVDSSPGSSQANKYYCFRAADSHGNVGYKASGQIGGSPTLQKITVAGVGGNRDLHGIGANLVIRLHFDEPIFVIGSERLIYLHVNSQDSPNSLNGFKAADSDLTNGVVALRYVVQRDDSTNSLQVLEILLDGDGDSIRDGDGNDAILDLGGLVVVDDNGDPRDIVIDGFKPTISLTQPDMSVWTATKIVSAVDDEPGNDSNWDYYFIPAETLDHNPSSWPQEIRCYLGDFLDASDQGTPYTEGEDIVLTDEHVGKYLCLRSRRAQSEFWDSWNRDRAGAVTQLIQRIDGSPPLISLRSGSGTLTPIVSDDASGVKDGSLFYELIGAEETCDADVFDGDETAYVSGQAIDIPIEYYGSRLCFTASDELDNAAYEPSGILRANRPDRQDRTPPTIVVEDPGNSDPARSKTVSADTDSTDAVDSSWIYKVYDQDEDDCGQALMSEGADAYRGGQTLILADEAFNGLSVCFSVSDEDGNEAFASSGVISGIDRQPPAVSVSLEDGNAVAVDDDDGPTTWKYRIILGSLDCDREVLEAGRSQDYVEGGPVSLNSHEGRKACFKATDEAGNSGFGDSDIFRVPTGQTGLTSESPPADDNSDDGQADGQLQQRQPSKEVISKVVSGNDKPETDDSFLVWWLLLSGAIFLIVLFFISRRRQPDEEDH